ncbi:MAG TPA: hypothetical protein VF507_02185, partial [Pyrinomonadaceae bacterium]
MAEQPLKEKRSPLLGDLGVIWNRRKQVWRLLPRDGKVGFGSALLVMVVVAYLENKIPLLLASFLNNDMRNTAVTSELVSFVMRQLAILSVIY